MFETKYVSEYRDFYLFAALATVWGTAYLAIDVGLRTVPPVTFAALRYDLAGLLLLGYVALAAYWRGDRWRPRGRDEWRLVGVGGVLVIGAHFALLFVGQRYASGGVASVVMSLTPVLTPLFALALLPNERIDATGAFGVLLGLVGVTVVATPDASGGGTLLGSALLFLSAASFALGAVLTRKYETDLSVVPMQAWMMLVGAAVLHALVIVLPGESVAAADLTVASFAALAYLAVVASVGGLLAYFHLLERVGPNEASLVNYAVPMVAAVGQWVAFGDAVSETTVAGFLFIVAGFVAVKSSTIRRAATPTPEREGASSQASNAGAVMVRDNVYYRDVE